MKARSQRPISVVINTCDRAKYLGDTLLGLQQQTYDNFEVIVVNGPSQDNTEEVAKSFPVRYYTAPFNISVSRNIGIKHAAGDIIAFIDDDAVPSPTWLEEIASGYSTPDIGAVGGWVYHVDKADYQFKYGAISKWGEPILRSEKDFDYNQPRGDFYNINIGTNATYARNALVSVGGFDEEIEYYHDESDVCVRLIDAGYKVTELEGAIVHHKMAPSSRRSSWQNVTNWDSVVKNGIYFALKHGHHASRMQRLLKPFGMQKQKFKLVALAFRHRQLKFWQFLYRTGSLIRAVWRGYTRGLWQPPKLLHDYQYDPKAFRRYEKLAAPKQTLHLTLVSQGFPPHATDGIARYNHTLAKELARQGHHVQVVTRSKDGRTQIVFSEGYWIHYHDPQQLATSSTGFERLDNILALTKSVYRTVEAINKEQPQDLILCPLWDVEGLALFTHKLAPTVLTLMSPLKKVVETQWSGVQDPSIETLYELEKFCIEQADAVMAISHAIQKTIGEGYGINWRELSVPVHVLPLGVDQSLVGAKPLASKLANEDVEILFVGRFEKRKGIDLLLNVMPKILGDHPQVAFRLIGNASLKDEDGINLYDEFKKRYHREKWFKRVHQEGYVTDEALAEAYRRCDIFVAPSRYESFGLIFIEAMANSKPIIGARVGGIPEIIADGVNGYLFEPENERDLAEKITRLLQNKQAREKMGAEGLELIRSKFNAVKMAQDVAALTRALKS